MFGADKQRSRRNMLVVVVGVVSVLCALLLLPDEDPGPLERASSLVEDAERFETGAEAAATLARAAQHLNDAIRTCTEDAPGSLRCQAVSAASGYTQVLATLVLTCTAPGRFEARTRTAWYLQRVDSLTTNHSTVPEPPPLPDC